MLTRSKEVAKDGAGQVRPPRPEESHSVALDFTHSISPIPLEAPFRTPYRMAFDVMSGFSPTLSVTIAGYRELVVRQGLAGTYEGALSTQAPPGTLQATLANGSLPQKQSPRRSVAKAESPAQSQLADFGASLGIPSIVEVDHEDSEEDEEAAD